MSAASGLVCELRGRVGELEVQVALETSGTLAIIGPNGSGKSSLLSMLLGTVRPREGRIELAGRTLLDTRAGTDIPVEQRRWGYVPQSYALFPHLDVEANVAFGVTGPLSGAQRRNRTESALARLGLLPLARRRTQTLSGGERQRVALARALASEPRGLLLDEPLSALDVHAREEVRSSLRAFLIGVALPTIIVTHDAQDARALGAEIAVMETGRITQKGSWKELVSVPASGFVRALTGSEPPAG
ncbi:MAG TPA: ABC transporter ATP-binding protein [Myxococcaceae bacterium]|nr:ABC transporter ATP-binding protein [Myxococcaceae bacterium]